MRQDPAIVGAAFAASDAPKSEGQDGAGLPAQCCALETLTDGCAATIAHDDKRHATARRFVTLAVKSGRIIGDYMPRRRARGLLKSLHLINRAVQGNPTVHLILDS